ncbi:MAG: RidA family protein [Acidobacteriota bacterium]
MEKQIVNPTSLVKPSGYAHGVVTQGGRLLFLAGQPALDAEGKIVAPGDIAGQFNQSFSNLKAVLEAAGGTMTDIVKLTLFVTDKSAYLANLKPIGAVYRAFFGRYYPAMTLVEVKSLFDNAAMVEIEGTAVIG